MRPIPKNIQTGENKIIYREKEKSPPSRRKGLRVSEHLAELYFLVVRPLNEEVSGAVLPEVNILNAIRKHVVARFGESPVNRLNVFYIEAEVIYGAVTHGRLGSGNNLYEQRTQLHEGEVAAIGSEAPRSLKTEAAVEVDGLLHIGRRQPNVLYASRPLAYIDALGRNVALVERWLRRVVFFLRHVVCLRTTRRKKKRYSLIIAPHHQLRL